MFSNELWQKSGVSTYSIDQSIRFNKADSAYLKKTFGSSASNRRTHTYSFWVKLGANAAGINANGGCFFLSTNDTGANAGDYLHLNGSLELRYWSNNSSAETFKTNQVFRDYSAWYHILLVNDRDNSVGSEAVRLYVNGQRVTSFAVDNISGRKSQDTMVNGSSYFWQIQRFTSGDVNGDCYMADIVFIDGQALGPSSFGEYSDDGIWIPKDVSDLTFGTNGFYIDGRDSSDLGDDESGQGNDFSTSGLAAHDQVLDTPTNNFAVYNILYNVGDVDFPTYSEGNLSVDFNYFGKRSPVSTFALPTDSDAYCEFYIKTSASSAHNSGVGIGQGDANNAGNVALTNGVTYNFNGYKHTGDGTATTFGNSYTAGDIIGVYFDQSDNEVDFYKNNTLEGSLSLSSYSGDLFFLVANNTTNQQVIIANFGQDDTFAGNKTSGSAGASDSSGNGKFYYTRISGAKALCSKSLGS